jgi:hypothetical protein
MTDNGDPRLLHSRMTNGKVREGRSDWRLLGSLTSGNDPRYEFPIRLALEHFYRVLVPECYPLCMHSNVGIG